MEKIRTFQRKNLLYAKNCIKKTYLESVYINNLFIINLPLSRTFFHQVEILKVQMIWDLVQTSKDLHKDKVHITLRPFYIYDKVGFAGVNNTRKDLYHGSDRVVAAVLAAGRKSRVVLCILYFLYNSSFFIFNFLFYSLLSLVFMQCKTTHISWSVFHSQHNNVLL